jgi:hypothetical protein
VATIKRFAMTILGGVLLTVGLALMVLPGPGLLLIVGGLAVLATEYVWARRLLGHARVHAKKAQRAAVANRFRTGGSVLFALGGVAVGVLMFAVRDVPWPVLDPLLDRVWTPAVGAVIVVTGLILLTTTYLTLRTARGEETTYTHVQAAPGAPDPHPRSTRAAQAHRRSVEAHAHEGTAAPRARHADSEGPSATARSERG